MILYPQYRSLPEKYVREKVAAFLAEDMPAGDVTTERTIGSPPSRGKSGIIAMEDLVLAGAAVIPACFGSACQLQLKAKDGDDLHAGDVIGMIQGNTAEMLSRERVMLNLIQRLSGIATLTRQYVQAAAGTGVKILDTRKTTPGLRRFEKYAVAVAGGYNHRLDLSSGILIKDNHLLAAGGVAAAVARCREGGSAFPLELEVDTLDQIREGLSAGVDGFLLDNMSPDLTREAVALIREHSDGDEIFIEASGGITLATLRSYLTTGIDAVSVGALTHSAGSRDIKLEFED